MRFLFNIKDFFIELKLINEMIKALSDDVKQ